MPDCGCPVPQPLENFPIAKGKRENWCRACKNKYHRKYYRANAPRKHGRRKRRRIERREMINMVKSAPCMDCGVSFDPVCMDFDHREGEEKHPAMTRKNGYMAMSQFAGTYSDEVVALELAKCDVVCACCHRMRTKARMEAAKKIEKDA